MRILMIGPQDCAGIAGEGTENEDECADCKKVESGGTAAVLYVRLPHTFWIRTDMPSGWHFRRQESGPHPSSPCSHLVD